MTQRRASPTSSRGLVRVVVFYLAIGVAAFLLTRYFPMVAEAFSGQRLDELAANDPFRTGGTPPVGDLVGVGTTWNRAFLALISMLGALAIMIPVTWVYMITHRLRGYDESVVHTMLILPVAVTGIVMIVQNSVALAFSLAGIVAAVRFRTTLDDTKDAVYVFLAIGVGLASGVQALGIAFVLSVVFNGVILVLWYTRFGNIYADKNTRGGPVALGDVLAGPGSAQAALQVGDPATLEAASPQDLAQIAERAVRWERHISEERAKKKRKRANTLVLVSARSAEQAQSYVDEVLTELSTRFKLVEIVPLEGQGVLLEYVARLEGAAVEGAVMDRLQRAPDGVVTAAEMRSMKGLSPRQ